MRDVFKLKTIGREVDVVPGVGVVFLPELATGRHTRCRLLDYVQAIMIGGES